MKILEKRYFVCEICGRTSQDEEKIKACQAGHRLVDDHCEIEHSFTKGGGYPKHLTITWPDGAKASFAFVACRDPEPESPEKD